MKKVSLLILFIICFSTLFSQTKFSPPIPLESFFGDQRAVLSFAVNKQIEGKFRYSNITTAAAFYDYKKGPTEVVTVNSILYQLHQAIGVGAGLQYHFLKGLVPSVSLNASYANPTWLVIVNPYYNFMPWKNFETVSIVEYKPQLAKNTRLFSRVQGFYAYDFDRNDFERGMIYLRLGVTHKAYTLGVGANYDYYIPQVSDVKNFGGFIRVDI